MFLPTPCRISGLRLIACCNLNFICPRWCTLYCETITDVNSDMTVSSKELLQLLYEKNRWRHLYTTGYHCIRGDIRSPVCAMAVLRHRHLISHHSTPEKCLDKTNAIKAECVFTDGSDYGNSVSRLVVRVVVNVSSLLTAVIGGAEASHDINHVVVLCYFQSSFGQLFPCFDFL